MRVYKYPTAQKVSRMCGKDSEVYAMTLALEQWAMAHGYKGYSRHNKRTKKQRELQQSIKGI